MAERNTKSSSSTEKPKELPAHQPRRLYRLPKAGSVAGVCAGLAVYLEMDVTLVRIIFVVLTLASGGFGVLAYLVMAVVMPVAGHGDFVKDAKGFERNVNELAEELQHNGGGERLRGYAGLALMLFGAWLLVLEFFPWVDVDWDKIWPALLIVCGVLLLARGKK